MGLSALIFPGQGAQRVGMARDVYEASPRARGVLERANEVLGYDLAGLCFDGPADRLEQTDIQQPAIFTASVALWEAFVEAGGSRDQFQWAGGLSLGEYTALHIGGAIGFDDALGLVHRRGVLMQDAAAAVPGGMVSLVGADEAAARQLCEAARGDEVLAPANFNCPGQVVISGGKNACDRALAMADEAGIRGVALNVAGAFHSPLMEPAADGLAPVLSATPLERPAINVIANVDAETHGEPAAIRSALRKQVTQPVLWQRCVERMIDAGVDRFVEIGPGRVLTGLIRRINRKVTAVNLSTAESIAKAMALAGAD